MDNSTISQDLQFATGEIYTKIANITWRTSELIISETTNPHRIITHPATGWHFFAEHDGHGYLAFAISPAGTWYLVDGAPARYIIELLSCHRCNQPATNDILEFPTCWDCLVRPPYRSNWNEDQSRLEESP